MALASKTVIFIIDRDIYFKFYSTIINEFLVRGFMVFLAHNHVNSRFPLSNKSLSFPSLSKAPQFGIDKTYQRSFIFKKIDELITKINNEKIEYVFSLHSRSYYSIDKNTIPSSKWVTLQHWADNFVSEHALKKDILDCDYLCMYSKIWWNGFLKSKFSNNIAKSSKFPKILFHGNPYHDTFENFDNNQIREKYGIDLSKRIVLYIPLGFGGNHLQTFSEKVWSHYYNQTNKYPKFLLSLYAKFLRSKITEVDLIKKMQAFCKDNDAILVIKGRVKKPIPQDVERLCDNVIYDETFYPSTICELISVSSLVISHFSMTIFDVINHGVFNINIEFNKIGHLQTYLYDKIFDESWKDDFSHFGLNQINEPDSFIELLKDKTLDDFIINRSDVNEIANKYFSKRPGQSTKSLVGDILNHN